MAIPKFFGFFLVKGYLNDVIRGNTVCQQAGPKKTKYQEGFSASPRAGDDLPIFPTAPIFPGIGLCSFLAPVC